MTMFSYSCDNTFISHMANKAKNQDENQNKESDGS